MAGRKNKDRQLAIAEGRKFYISGTACKKCGCVIKYVSSYGCHYCDKVKGREILQSGALEKYRTTENHRENMRRWRKNNPEAAKAANQRKSAIRNARKKGRVPLTEQEKSDIIEVYSLARRMSAETGIPHEVDHIKPLSKGGLHHPDNLQVLTANENRRKYNRY